MRNLKVVVIVPEGQKYKLASCFSTDRLESLKRKGFDVEVEKLIEPNIGFDEIENEAIVLDARPESKIHFRMPESYYTLLTQKEFCILARTLRYQMWHLDDSDRIFMNDIRSLCEYVFCHCPDDVFDVILKHQFVDVVWPDIQTMEPDIKQCHWEYLKYEIGIVEKRLSQVVPQEFHGQIERYLECCK